MRTFLFIALTILYCSSTFAQADSTFQLLGTGRNVDQITKDGRLDISKIKVENITDGPIYLEWETISNTFPAEWDCSMCQHGACQIGIPKRSVFNKLNADQQGFIAIHVIPKNTVGTGTVQFKLYDRANPDFFKILTFEVEVL